MDVCSSFIHNCQYLQTTKMSFSGWMGKLAVVHPDNGIAEKKLTIKPWKDMGEP